jgi:NADH-quinone oxidoreductase subunit D
MLRQMIEKMPSGDYRIQDPKVTPPPRGRIDASMEALIHHFKIFTEGFKVPEGEVYAAIESPRGELGCYMVSDGSSKPFRMHIRGPSFVNLQVLPLLLRGGLLSDAVACISSVDPVMGEVDR